MVEQPYESCILELKLQRKIAVAIILFHECYSTTQILKTTIQRHHTLGKMELFAVHRSLLTMFDKLLLFLFPVTMSFW